MGLDMYVRKTKQELPAAVGFRYVRRESFNKYPEDYDEEWLSHPHIITEEDEETDLYYWRKHPNLHGWFGKLYAEKHGVDDDSDGVDGWGLASEGNFAGPVQVVAEDLDRLERLVEADGLPRTEGFFFGASGPEDKKDDRLFIAKAREALDDGYSLFYWASW